MSDDNDLFLPDNGWLSGKQLAIQDWQHRKEEADFEKLCRTVQQLNRLKKDPEMRARITEKQRQWRADNPERYQAAEQRKLAAGRERRRYQHHGMCRECNTQWRGPRKRLYCGSICQDRARWRRQQDRRRKGARNPHIRAEITAALRAEPWIGRAVLAGMIGLSGREEVLSRTLSNMLKAQQIKHDGKRTNRLYANIDEVTNAVEKQATT